MDLLVDKFVSMLLEYNYQEKCSDYTSRIVNASTTLEKAILCITKWPFLYYTPRRTDDIITELLKFEEVVEVLKQWRGEKGETIFELSDSVSFLRRVIKPLSEEKFQAKAKELMSNRRYRPWNIEELINDVDFNESDKLKCEEVWSEVKSRYAFVTDRIVVRVWLMMALKFPSSNDLEIATQMIIAEIQLRDMYPVLLDLLKAFPNLDVQRIVSEVKVWPGPYARQTSLNIRKELPHWLLQGILDTTVQDCNFSWIRKQLKNKRDRDEDVSFHLFEDLPEDIIYYMMSQLSFRTVVALSQTSKRMMKLVNESQHGWTVLGQKYFTKIPVTSAADFDLKYKSKFEIGKLMHHFKASKHYMRFLSSIELVGDKILSVEMNGMMSIINTRCLEPSKNGKFQGKKQKKKKFVNLAPDMHAYKSSARLFNDHIYALSIQSEQSLITIIKLQKISEKRKVVQCPERLHSNQIYFTIDQKSLLAHGFGMDLTTQQITEQHWTKDLSKWIIRDDIIYGWRFEGHKGRHHTTTDCVKLFDTRTPGKLIGELQCEKLQCFNVRDNDIYSVSSHVMQWDKRYLSRPVRTSTDPYFSYKARNGPLGHPAIDLTSMTVIGADQIWDLTDFTWQLTSLPREKNTIVTNGVLVAYTCEGATNVRQVACTKGITGPISTHAELRTF